MITLGILHATLPAYMQQAGEEESKHLQVIVSAADFASFEQQVGRHKPQVLAVDLALLGNEPSERLQRLEQVVQPELTLVVYAFAKWGVVESLRAPGRQVVRAPISVRMLRANLINLIVREITQRRQLDGGLPAVPAAPPPPRRFDDVQLVSLQEIRSQVDCECPNQVADLVLALGAFEAYSRQCENRNAADARIHALLARATGHARALMETALGDLCAFEKIDIQTLPRRSA